jgi:hypothetical protein
MSWNQYAWNATHQVTTCQLCYSFSQLALINKKKKKGKAIPVTGHEGLYDCETSRLPHFLDNRLTDGCKAVSALLLERCSGTHFC